MLQRLLISFLVLMGAAAPVPVASGAAPPFRSDKLEAMAEVLGKATIAALPDGESRLSWQTMPICVVKCGGTVEHIGYALFSEEQKASAGQTPCRFLERYALEADLPLPREKTLEVQLLEDGVSFPRGGGLRSLLQLSRDPGLPLRLSKLGERKYLLEWGSVAVVFPADAELLLGRSQAENERRLPGELAGAPAPVSPPLPAAGELVKRPDNILVEERGWYYLAALNANRYFVAQPDGTLLAVDTPAHPSETIANILSGLVEAGAVTLQLKRSVYGLKQDYFSVPLGCLAGYAQQFGCTVYWGVIAQDEELLEGEIVLRNEAAGFNHVLRLQVPYKVLAAKEGHIQARLTPFVPMHSLKYLFEETRQ